MDQPIVNRVAESGIITIDLEEMIPQGNRHLIDIKDQLFMGMILKEKDFREWLKTQDWDQYRGGFVAVTCTADAVIPTWAYMLIASRLSGVAAKVVFGTQNELEIQLLNDAVNEINASEFSQKRVVVKGCGNKEISPAAYMTISSKLVPVVKSLMFGEPCSTVPVFKKS